VTGSAEKARVADGGLCSALLARCAGLPPAPTAIAHPCDEVSILAAVEAAAAGLITPILVGPEHKIRAAAEAAKVDISPFRLAPAPHRIG